MRRLETVLPSIGLALSLLAVPALAEPPRDADVRPDLRGDVEDLLRFLEADADAERLSQLFAAVQQPGRPAEELLADVRELYTQVWKGRGYDPESAYGQAYIQATAQFATTMLQIGGRYDLRLPAVERTYDGLAVVSKGRGKVPMLLIADVGVDAAELYRTFMDSGADRYTMHAVSLPGFGGSGQLPWPEVYAPSRMPWLTAAEDALADFVEKKKLEDFVVVGTSGGGYFAARLALRMPARIRAVVLSGAAVRTIARSQENLDLPADLEERALAADQAWPIQLLPIPPMPAGDELDAVLASNQHPIYRNFLSNGIRDDERSLQWTKRLLLSGALHPALRYSNEFGATDLTDGLLRLKVPTLAMVPIHDDGSIGQGVRSNVNQWREIKLLAPEIPLTVVVYEDTRSYISEDRPEMFAQAVDDLLAGRDVEGLDERRHGVRQSPHACLAQVVGRTEVEICYGRPAVREREVWGQLVPWERVWRTGADEATTVAFSTDVALGGECIEQGRYSLFTLPREQGEWTVILNRIADQWGAFQYDPQFDVHRFDATPQTAEHRERLSFGFDELGESSGRVVVHWEKRALPFEIEGQGSDGPPSACSGG